MTQVIIARKQKQTSSRKRNLKLPLALLIFSPLFYSIDGDPYREYEVVLVGILSLVIAPPNIARLASRVRLDMAYVLAIAFLIAIQPAFVAGAALTYNLQFMVVLLACFLPTLYLSECNPIYAKGQVVFINKALLVLFGITASSLIISVVTGVGEVYTEGGTFQQRAFSWLGDSFSPVMVFFLYYFIFRRSTVGIIIALACLLVVMQAKMAMGMATLGCLINFLIFGTWTTRLFFSAAIAIGVLFMPAFFELAAANIHNFEYSLNNRLLSFDSGLTFFQSSPWFGVGANQTFTLLSREFDITALDRYEQGMAIYEFFQVHNSFIRILAELGLIGFLFFTAFCLTILRQSYYVLKFGHDMQPSDTRALLMACSLWLISFILFYQTTGWFEPGHPQLSWLVCFWTLMNFVQTSRK